jgi:hypothetical protein
VRWYAIDGPIDDAGERDLGAAVTHLADAGLDASRFHRIDGQQAGGDVGRNPPCLSDGHRLPGEKIVEQQGVERCLEQV